MQLQVNNEMHSHSAKQMLKGLVLYSDSYI
jgi:hypothetical protein